VYVESYPLPNLELRETQSQQLPTLQQKQKQQRPTSAASNAAKDKAKGKKPNVAAPVKGKPAAAPEPPANTAVVEGAAVGKAGAGTDSELPPVKGNCIMIPYKFHFDRFFTYIFMLLLQRVLREVSLLVCSCPALIHKTLLGKAIVETPYVAT
jgi:hypothetical protein